MELRRIDHIGIVVPGFVEGAAAVIEHVTIWRDAATSGGVQYRFLRRPEP